MNAAEKKGLSKCQDQSKNRKLTLCNWLVMSSLDAARLRTFSNKLAFDEVSSRFEDVSSLTFDMSSPFEDVSSPTFEFSMTMVSFSFSFEVCMISSLRDIAARVSSDVEFDTLDICDDVLDCTMEEIKFSDCRWRDRFVTLACLALLFSFPFPFLSLQFSFFLH